MAEQAADTQQSGTKYPLLAKAQGDNVPAPAPPQEAKVAPDNAPPPPPVVAQPGQGDAPPEKVSPAKNSIEDLDDEAALKEFNKRFGTKFTSLDDLKPPVVKTEAEILAEKAARKDKSLEWALSSGKITRAAYEKAIAEKAKPVREIALSVFANELREVDPKISEDEIEERFKDEYREEEDENSPLRKLANKRMEKVANSYLSEISSGVDSIETDFEAHEATTQRLEGYGRQIKAVAEALPKELSFKFPFTNADGSVVELEYKVPIDDATAKAVRKEFLSAEMYHAVGADKSDLKDKVYEAEMLASIKLKMYDNVITNLVTTHGEEVERRTIATMKAVPATTLPLAAQTVNTGEKTTKVPDYPLLRAAQKK